MNFVGSQQAILLGVIFAISTSSCGGGGGGGSQPSAPGAIPPPSATLLEITESNALNAARIATNAAEELLAFAYLAAIHVLEADDRGLTNYSRDCLGGGALDVDVTDVSNDGVAGAGDSIRVTFRSCSTVVVSEAVSGDLQIDLSEGREKYSSEFVLAGEIDAYGLQLRRGQSLWSTPQGRFSFKFERSDWAETLSVMGSVNLELDLGGDIQYERLTDFNIRKVLDFERAEYSISGSGTVDSELLGAPVRIDSSSMLGGRFNEGPSRGRFAVTGDNDDHAALAPGPETDQRLLTVELSRGGLSSYEALDVDARWGSFVDGLLWWYPPSRPGGVTPGVPPEKGFASALPTVRPQEPQVYGVFAPLRMQFTDRIDPATVPASASAEIRYLSVEEQIVDWPETSTALDVEHRGAAILLRPTGQLKHDRDYMYLLDPASELLTEGEGQPLFPSVRTELRTKATLRAVASSNARFSFPESSIVLNGAQSVSTPGGTLRYSWTDGEVEGSQFSSPSASGTEYSPGPTISDQLVELRLRVTDDLGEYDDARIRLTVFPDPSATRLLGVSVATDDWLGPGRSALVTSATATPRIDTVGVNAVTVTFSESPLPGYGRIWSLSIEAPNDDPLLPGKYEYGNGNPISDPTLPSIHLSANSRSCNPISAAFEVFEIEYDGTGLVNRLAVDYSITCQFSSDAPSGFLRWNSDWPIGAN